MDEDEELYREMNEEDDFYMGNQDPDDNEDEDPPTNVNNSGCLGMFISLLLILFLSSWI